ncbi:hypothetical protein P280DRAFT_485613 [Massarina eburnea CBS 473.64]|uniref:Uncharacterized protein n=1 Tax=Massarina eburnea CBS 473.64 TaxID=1395130 RepID=A0A6A6RJJ2_9PLEO|nr:hypothetical protein P280DRAFT_485613 [Massarina eburnea CBS 473.64]
MSPSPSPSPLPYKTRTQTPQFLNPPENPKFQHNTHKHSPETPPPPTAPPQPNLPRANLIIHTQPRHHIPRIPPNSALLRTKKTDKRVRFTSDAVDPYMEAAHQVHVELREDMRKKVADEADRAHHVAVELHNDIIEARLGKGRDEREKMRQRVLRLGGCGDVKVSVKGCERGRQDDGKGGREWNLVWRHKKGEKEVGSGSGKGKKVRLEVRW